MKLPCYKVKHATMHEAKVALEHANKSDRRLATHARGTKLRAYKCPFCGAYHLGRAGKDGI